MSQTRHAAYGTWNSLVSAASVAAQSLSAGIFLDPITSKGYFAQKRPEENGRSAIVDAVSREDLLDSSWDARTQVHEYGGAAAMPELPWQSAEVVVAPCSVSEDTQQLSLGPITHVAGKHGSISAQDPGWASDNTLFFFRDTSGYQNPWKFTFDPTALAATEKASPILPTPIEEEFGAPQWWLSRHGSGALDATTVAFLSFRQARSTLYVCDITKASLVEVPTNFARIQHMHGDGKGKVVMLGHPSDSGEVLSELVLTTDGQPIVRQVDTHKAIPLLGSLLSHASISTLKYNALKLATDNRVCHVTYYGPKNMEYDGGLPGERPRVVILIHGGPFYMEPSALDWSKQFFTSRGWAYLDVNAHTEKVFTADGGFWTSRMPTIVCFQLDEMGLLDKNRAVAHGGSAGGYSVLQLLPLFRTSSPPEPLSMASRT